jgi:hypothetical protein
MGSGDTGHAIVHFLLNLSIWVGVFFVIVVPVRMFRRGVERREWRRRMNGVGGSPAEFWVDMRPPPPDAGGGM